MDVVRGLELLELLETVVPDLDLSVRATSSRTATLTSRQGLRHVLIRALDTPPTPARVMRELGTLGRGAMAAEALLYVVPRSTASLRAIALADPRVIVAAVDQGAVLIDGTEWSRTPVPAPVRGSRGRTPWGRFALMRALVRTGAPRTQSELASETGVTQQAIALALPALHSLGVERTAGGWVGRDASALWDEFLSAYPGPSGVRRRWTSVAALDLQRQRAVEAARSESRPVLVSGDSAADTLAPVRRPVVAVLYSEADLDLAARFTTAPLGDETLAVVVPADPTVFATARAWDPHGAPTLTDPLVTAWEVANSRGPDRDDAVLALRRVTLDGRDER
ncbi:hypothetical protein ACIPEP_01065 [Curtobacterium sp. NPDC087082]|uniref:hypothetical protein n=1 Tax=Curtobacterium sp. NPDC087082 TaxID=3363966 RepID=UPI0038003695